MWLCVDVGCTKALKSVMGIQRAMLFIGLQNIRDQATGFPGGEEVAWRDLRDLAFNLRYLAPLLAGIKCLLSSPGPL